VTLNGTVENAASQRQARTHAIAVAGVTTVINNLLAR
jgi:osmotically-inducible protein OsmY